MEILSVNPIPSAIQDSLICVRTINPAQFSTPDLFAICVDMSNRTFEFGHLIICAFRITQMALETRLIILFYVQMTLSLQTSAQTSATCTLLVTFYKAMP